ncbi:MAG: 30S ribosomal protein S16 [Candidatus Liptonbacteria bacterium]|nr:30S ribosomal protein S16 [Candidatus Liptonbacteria bacterium]
MAIRLEGGALYFIDLLCSYKIGMLAIKLQRKGKKKQPSYRVIVQEKREKLGGLYVEDLGWYNPLNKEAQINAERVKYWIGVGARPTPTANNLLIKKGVIEGKKIPVHKKFVAPTLPSSSAEATDGQGPPSHEVTDGQMEASADAEALADKSKGEVKPAEAAPAAVKEESELQAEIKTAEEAVPEPENKPEEKPTE